MIGQFAILILSIDALLRMLLDNDQTKEFIPEKLRKQNKYGAFSNGIWLVVILSGVIILIQTVMPGGRPCSSSSQDSIRFVKNQKITYFFGGWCFLITAACCIMGMYNKDPLTMALNIITPIVLTALGLILPMIAKREQRKES